MKGLKTIIIMRHAKSSWESQAESDFARPLAQRGIKNAKEAAQVLLANQLVPEIIFSSPATRAIETALLVCEVMSIDETQIRQEPMLYWDDAKEIKRLIEGIENSAKSCLVIGHQPTLSDFINTMLQRPLENVITASLTVLDFNAESWASVNKNSLVSARHFNRHNWQGEVLL